MSTAPIESFHRYAIAAPEPQAAAAGERAITAGGNAIDAALAAAAALTVAFPHNCALGGDLIALVRHPDGTITSINASGPAPRAASADTLRRQRSGSDAVDMPTYGPSTVTVPGLVAGWERLHGEGAVLDWPTLLGDAVRLASEGTVVSVSLGDAIEATRGAIAADPGLREVFGGLSTGDRLVQPALANTLQRLATHGPRDFYAGEVAARLVDGFGRAGIEITAEDLLDFVPETTRPISIGFRGLEVFTSPPNSSGVMLLQALAALESSGVADPLGVDAPSLAGFLRQSAAQRSALLADPRTSPQRLDDWLGAPRIAELVGTTAVAVREPTTRPSGDTVAVVTADGEGRMVSLIQSVFHSFGSRILDPGTGVLLHNRGSFFSLVPGHPNELAPGRRPAHTLMPLLVTENGSPRYALGTMGGKAHPQILAQVLLRLLSGFSAQAAVGAPRWIVGGVEMGESDDTIRVEADLDESAAAALRASHVHVVDVPARDEVAGHTQAIAVGDDGGFDVGSDPRAGGAALAG